MNRYDPEKMVPVEAVAPTKYYKVVNGNIRKIKEKPQTPEQRKTTKKVHTRKSRRINKRVEDETL